MVTREMDVKQIERAITQLQAKDFADLMGWIKDYKAQVWYRQIEEDLEAGRLDVLLAEVKEEYEAGLSQPL